MFTTGQGLALTKKLYYRDSFVYLFTLAILTFFLQDNKIELFEALILILLYPAYLYISTPVSNSENASDISIGTQMYELGNSKDLE